MEMIIKDFYNQIRDNDKIDTIYGAGEVCELSDGNYIVGYCTAGAEDTFSIGQPVYDADSNLLGYLGIGLFENLNNATSLLPDEFKDVRIPSYYWRICLPTPHCKPGKEIFTYWQNRLKEER